MKSIGVWLLACLSVSSIVWAQEPPVATKAEISPADQARLNYHRVIKEYVLRYAQTPASCSEIAEAAISTYNDEAIKVTRLFPGADNLSWNQLEEITDKFKILTKNWALKVALEAKYPGPTIYKAPAPASSQPPAARQPKKK